MRAGGLSLKARAVALLSRREYSRHELARRLCAHAASVDELNALLDQLAREGWQSDERFAQSLLNRRAQGRGVRRIQLELREHGIAPEVAAESLDGLHASEAERARTLWQKKFGQAAQNRRDYARQFRFLASRGFTAECVRAILGDPPPA